MEVITSVRTPDTFLTSLFFFFFFFGIYDKVLKEPQGEGKQ